MVTEMNYKRCMYVNKKYGYGASSRRERDASRRGLKWAGIGITTRIKTRDLTLTHLILTFSSKGLPIITLKETIFVVIT